MKRLKLESIFFLHIGNGGILVAYTADATHWPQDDSGPAHWDVEVATVECSLLGYGIVKMKCVTLEKLDTHLANFIAERTQVDAHAELLEKLRTANPVDFIKWPTEVDF